MSEPDILMLAELGVERICIPLDTATPELFERFKGDGYTWGGHVRALEEARSIFGERVTTHLILGLGETEKEAVETIQSLHDRHITVALFAFTPVAGTPLSNHPRPDVAGYRRVQLARHLIVRSQHGSRDEIQ